MKRVLVIAILAVAGVVLAMQLVPVDRSNPPVTGEVVAPPDVKAVLRRCCFDCHSHETRWPWYSWIAPASWIVARDVEQARRRLNFSTWDAYYPLKRAEKARKCWEEISDGAMPLPLYLFAHPGARLTLQDRETIRAWSAGAHPGAGEVDR